MNNNKAAIKLETEIVARGKPSSPRIRPAKTAAITLTALQNTLAEAMALVCEQINLAEMILQIDDFQARRAVPYSKD